MRTMSPDITYPDDTDPRVLLSCGHAMTADTLYQNITVQLKNGKKELRCFKCNKEWDFQDTAGKAQMSMDEKFFWGNKISLNSICDECPKCGYYCERITEENDRVECMRCIKLGTDFEFCWKCKCQWTTNHKCKSKEDIQNMLQNCKTKEIQFSDIPNVPTIRLCPSCGALIEHIDMCKEMKCYRCEKSFCFVCLTMCKNGKLGCTKYDLKCPVAPVQTA
ncbi:E3 ubiquitin-protein ligase RNF19B-like [Mytilus galloprovincialis]|uniref:E3 ubiquitin-protein ligase RNF19B-like n=1 Tax=Mytilus galloprovincialis TaxID=29158 RepID=UPI003F7BE755